MEAAQGRLHANSPWCCRYSVFRRVVGYYSDDPTGKADGEDAFDMRKPLARDKELKHIRENGEEHRVWPEDVW